MRRYLKKSSFPPTFIDLLLKKNENGEPWVPSWQLSLIAFPLFTLFMFVGDELSGFGGIVSPDKEPKSWSEIDWGSFPFYAACFMGIYYFVILPIFFLKRAYWRKIRAKR